MDSLTPINSNFKDTNKVVNSNVASGPLLQSEIEIEKIVSKKCQIHPLKNAELLHLKPNVQNPRICINCVQQNGIQTQEYLQIKEVLLGSNNSDLFTYPVLNDPQLRQEIQLNFNALDSDKSQIDYFYQELLKEIQAKIEARRQTKQPQILQLADIYQRSTVSWSEILDIDKLKQILFEENNESKLNQFISEHIANSDSNTRRLKEICDSFKPIQSQFSMERPNEIKKQINSLLDQISFFAGTNQSPPFSVSQSGQSINELQLRQQEVNQLQVQLPACRSQLQQQDARNKERGKAELVAAKSTDLLPSTNLILSNWEDSKTLQVRKNNEQQLEFFNNDTQENVQGRSYLDLILEPLENYVVQVKLEQTKGLNKNFWFGLLADSKKDDSEFDIDELLCYSEQNDYGIIDTQIKGEPINSKDNSLEKRILEMRINIQRKILKVGSLPNYDSVVQLDYPELINPNTPYRFYLGGLNMETKMTIIKLQTVIEFDNLM